MVLAGASVLARYAGGRPSEAALGVRYTVSPRARLRLMLLRSGPAPTLLIGCPREAGQPLKLEVPGAETGPENVHMTV